jgi:hypothetical protein
MTPERFQYLGRYGFGNIQRFLQFRHRKLAHEGHDGSGYAARFAACASRVIVEGNLGPGSSLIRRFSASLSLAIEEARIHTKALIALSPIIITM